MLSFPNYVTVSIPATCFLEGDCLVSVRINPEDDVRHLKASYGRRLLNFEVDSAALKDLSFIHTLAGMRVRVLMVDRGLFESGEIMEALSQIHTVFTLRPDSKLLRYVNFLTSLNFQVHIDTTLPNEVNESIESTADFYLHNPLLTIPIEPFHTLLCTLNRSKCYNLWDIESENVRSNFFVTEAGDVSLSKRWHMNDLNYCKITNSWDELIRSELFRKLSSFKSELFRRKDYCIFCGHFDLCGGFLKAIDSDRICESWQRVFFTLRSEVKRAKNLLQKYHEA
jgi:hypothetical protein